MRVRAGHLEIANPIYREVIPRALTYLRQVQIPAEPAAFDTLGLDEGWLVMFDLRAKRPWSKRLTMRTRKVGKKRVRVVGC